MCEHQYVGQKQLGLDEDTYRLKLFNITGKSSAKDMTEQQRQKVLTVLRNAYEQGRVQLSQDGEGGSAAKAARGLRHSIAAANAAHPATPTEGGGERCGDRQALAGRDRPLLHLHLTDRPAGQHAHRHTRGHPEPRHCTRTTPTMPSAR